MTETLYRILLMFVFVSIFMWGGSIQSKTYKYEVEKPRTMLMVDAYEAYSDTGKPYWTGIFRDKEFNTRIENPIEPKTYRDFVGSNSAPRDMVVKASLMEVKDPKAPNGSVYLAKTLMALGFFGFFFNLIAVFFFRDPWRWA